LKNLTFVWGGHFMRSRPNPGRNKMHKACDSSQQIDILTCRI
jgi:hypothetical protein